jgi:hypothetical protein
MAPAPFAPENAMAALAFTRPEQFERTLLRFTAGAAAGGVASGLALSLGAPGLGPALVLGGALAALGRWRSTLPLGALGLIAGAMQTLGTAHALFYDCAAGALTAAGIALSHQLAPSPRREPPGRTRLTLLLVLGAAGLVLGQWATAVFASHGAFAVFPGVLDLALRGSLTGFFIALCSAALHLDPGTDPVESLHREVGTELTGELARLASQAVELYRRCREALARGPQGPAQLHLSRSLVEVTSRGLVLARKWHGVDAELGDRAEVEVARRLGEVEQLLERSADETARKHLQVAQRGLHAEQVQIQRIRAGRERVVARLHADLAILERTRFALLALRSTDAHLTATELAHLSDSLGAMGQEMDVESQAIDDALRVGSVLEVQPARARAD